MAVTLAHPLQQQLDQITATTRALVQPERLARTDQVVAELGATGIEAQIAAPGSQAPSFSLPAANGKLVRSADLLALGPLVLKFFRGRWCPYDMTELEAWQALLPTLRQATRGRPALFVAISPQTPRQNAFTAENQAKPGGLTFPILSDPGCGLADQLGTGYTVPEPTRFWYRSMLVNIPLINGDDAWRLPLPATVILNQAGTVLYAEGYADHRRRPDPQAALEVLGTI